MPKLTTLCALAAAAAAERGFLLIATRNPIALLRHDPSKKRATSSVPCSPTSARRYRALLVVGDEREKRMPRRSGPVRRVDVEVLRHRTTGALGTLRLFKVSALHKYCDYFPGGTLR